MPTSLEHGPKYRCRRVNSGRHTLDMRTNGTWHDIPNITYLKKERREEGRGFKRVHNQMGEARPPKTTEHCRLAYIYMLASLSFCLCLGDRALALCVLTLCVYMQRQRQETNRQAMEGKDAKSI